MHELERILRHIKRAIPFKPQRLSITEVSPYTRIPLQYIGRNGSFTCKSIPALFQIMAHQQKSGTIPEKGPLCCKKNQQFKPSLVLQGPLEFVWPDLHFYPIAVMVAYCFHGPYRFESIGSRLFAAVGLLT